MRLKEVSSEVLVADEPIVKIGPPEIALLKEKLKQAPRGRVRICAHAASSDPLHEMIIALANTSYIRPHKHVAKSESFHIVEGSVDVVALEDDGKIREVIKLGAPGTGRTLFYRLASPIYHTLLIRSEALIIHETTNGPFKASDAVFAPWAPEESDAAGAREYMERLDREVKKLNG